MYDPDDIRYSKRNERPPWELPDKPRLRDSFSHHKVDETSGSERCNDVERQKAERQKAYARNMEAHRQAQSQREEAQRRMERERDAAQHSFQQEQEQASQTADPKAGRYDYSRTNLTSKSRRRRSSRSGVGMILVIALVISAVAGLISGYRDQMSGVEEVEEVWGSGFEDSYYDEDYDEDGEWDDWDDSEEYPGGFGADDYFGDPDSEDYEEYPTSEDQEELPRAELPGTMELDIVSAAGKQALTYQELYAKCAPSTVSITVYSSLGMGTGTGIIMTEDGYILTCAHVVDDSSSCTVTTWDDAVYDAELVGSDAQTDIALLKIEAEGLTAAEFGDSDELTVGDEALAIGDPLGTELRGTLTNGIISAINRNVIVNSYSMTLIQTTAALNSGNSGGPLINIYGQVVGINNMKINSGAVTVEGLGFAVPTSVVREIVPVLTEKGQVSRPVLGITCYSVTEEMAEAYGYPSAGLIVASVDQGSDCYTQGLQVGDMICAVNGEPVWEVPQVKVFLDEMDVGDSLTLSIIRFESEDDPTVYEEFELEVELVDQADIS